MDANANNSSGFIKLIYFLFFVIILFGCSADAPSVPPTVLPTNTQLPTALPTNIQLPPTPTLNPSPSPDLNEWDLLIVSDSSNWGVGEYYARLIEQDMNVKVNLHDCWQGNLSVKTVLRAFESGRNWSSYVGDKSCLKPLSDLVKEAEVMVFFANDMDSDSPMGMGTCMSGGYVNKNKMQNFDVFKNSIQDSCALENRATFKLDLGLAMDAIFKLREGSPLILRMTDVYIPVHADFKRNAVDDVCTACLVSFAETIRQAASEHGVPVADTMQALNGMDYLSDPVEAGYIAPDGEHLSDFGAQFVATLLQQTGYAYAGK